MARIRMPYGIRAAAQLEAAGCLVTPTGRCYNAPKFRHAWHAIGAGSGACCLVAVHSLDGHDSITVK